MTSSFHDVYDALEVIGNGSFGIIRKVRRKSDGLIFACKELNFERMNERDRKLIVSEVNILSDLNHENIVRYHDRFVDRDASILYILMEHCGGGDLTSIIKHARKSSRPIPEDTIWNYFLQIVLALSYCHHPDNSGLSDRKKRRGPILHRDLKPDNILLNDSDVVKLGDFGLSKALDQVNFTETYVGTPYYMSPELVQGKPYDSKSDIWSLGCLVHELCALKPPFHEAQTQRELKTFIQSGRIPPLPRGYSQALTNIIKAMLNLNPTLRPAAAELLKNERLELALKVSQTEKMLLKVKQHKGAILEREKEVSLREAKLADKEANILVTLTSRDTEVKSLRQLVVRLQGEHRLALAQREEEMQWREEALVETVRAREKDLYDMWVMREAEVRREMEEEFREREGKPPRELEYEQRQSEAEPKVVPKGASSKAFTECTPKLYPPSQKTASIDPPRASAVPKYMRAALLTPSTTKHANASMTPLASAMKGIVLTSTGEQLATPTPAELAKLFTDSPLVGLVFPNISSFGVDAGSTSGDDAEDAPPSPSERGRIRNAVSRKPQSASQSRPLIKKTMLVPSMAPHNIVSSSHEASSESLPFPVRPSLTAVNSTTPYSFPVDGDMASPFII